MMMVIFMIKFIPKPNLDKGLINNYVIDDEEGVILEEDSEDEEGYMFAGQGSFFMFHIVVC